MLGAGIDRDSVGKVSFVEAKERGDQMIAKLVKNADTKTDTEFVTPSTDESRFHGSISKNHVSVCHSAGEYMKRNTHTNSIELLWVTLMRSVQGIWHHVSPKHLHQNENETAVRLNIRDYDIKCHRPNRDAGEVGQGPADQIHQTGWVTS